MPTCVYIYKQPSIPYIYGQIFRRYYLGKVGNHVRKTTGSKAPYSKTRKMGGKSSEREKELFVYLEAAAALIRMHSARIRLRIASGGWCITGGTCSCYMQMYHAEGNKDRYADTSDETMPG